MNLPGFTGEASVYKTSRHYRAMPESPIVTAALTLALYAQVDGPQGSRARSAMSIDADIDCTDFPDNQTCRECGPWGTLDCCALRRGPNDFCIIRELSIQAPRTSRFPRFPAILEWLGNPAVRR
jgi:hypothetical protein